MEEEVAYHLELEVDRGVVEEIPFQEALVVLHLVEEVASFLQEVVVLEVQEASFLLEELVGQVEVVGLIPYQAELVVLVLEGQVEPVGLEEVLAYSLEGVAVTCYQLGLMLVSSIHYSPALANKSHFNVMTVLFLIQQFPH